jgi:outer membrane receptor for ferrienterochelin and colicin
MKRMMMAMTAGVVLFGTGCSVRPITGGTDGSPSPRGRTVDAEDIARSSVRTAWDALQLLGAFLRLEEDKDQRPARMTARGQSSILLDSEPQVVMDGVRLVEYTVLRGMNANVIERIEFLTGPEATTRYGTNSGHGVILITTRTSVEGGT